MTRVFHNVSDLNRGRVLRQCGLPSLRECIPRLSDAGNSQRKLAAWNQIHETGTYGSFKNATSLNYKSHTVTWNDSCATVVTRNSAEQFPTTLILFGTLSSSALKMDTVRSPKRCYLPTSTHIVTSQKKITVIFSTVRTSNFSFTLISKKLFVITRHMKPDLCNSFLLCIAHLRH
jgi:hypothetical protein